MEARSSRQTAELKRSAADEILESVWRQCDSAGGGRVKTLETDRLFDYYFFVHATSAHVSINNI